MPPADPEDQASILSIGTVKPSPDTMTKLINRLRALTMVLLPVQVDPDSICDVTSRIITPKVIDAYMAAGGDLYEALPYALLRARVEFLYDAMHNPADYDEFYARSVACEVLARRIVHKSHPDRLATIMSTRFRHRQMDGDASDTSSALELAIDTHCTIFLSSSEAQSVVNDLWNGNLVQRNNAEHDIDYDLYLKKESTSFWSHLDPERLSVPRYQNIVRIIIWLFFLVVYSQAVREPLDRLDPDHLALDAWEIVLYVMALSFFIEDTLRFFKLMRFASYRAFSFWNIISFITGLLLLAAFIVRVIGLTAHGDQIVSLRLLSFQILSYVSPLIWMRLITIFDGFKYIGTMQICVARMLQESGIFFALLSVMGIGFFQGLYALDAADGSVEDPSSVVNVLIQAVFGAADFGKFSASPGGLTLYYFWNIVTALILLNILISLFATAYSDVVDDAEAHFLAYFAGKTIGMIRAPDAYVYPAPFNLVELVFVAPLEWLPSFIRPSDSTYRAINRYTMATLFFIPLGFIALFESTFSSKKHWVREWLASDNQGESDRPEHRDPKVDDDNNLVISKVPFSELIKVFPDTQTSSESNILAELGRVQEQLRAIQKKLESHE